ncbi:hypothetical protein GOODEAATRI_010993 [Goodea atripinnis]|uniref:Uncharacterized protein n=1 Tax=Goodea atripinnis TaxID=208336 RepID=A0ABV0NTL4_9TELE
MLNVIRHEGSQQGQSDAQNHNNSIVSLGFNTKEGRRLRQLFHSVQSVTVGSLAGETQRGSRRESQSEHHRAVISLDREVRRRSARTDSDSGTILHHLHAVLLNSGHRRRKKTKGPTTPCLQPLKQQT